MKLAALIVVVFEACATVSEKPIMARVPASQPASMPEMTIEQLRWLDRFLTNEREHHAEALATDNEQIKELTQALGDAHWSSWWADHGWEIGIGLGLVVGGVAGWEVKR